MKLTFEAYNKDGSPRKFVGMFRPPYEECIKEIYEKHFYAYDTQFDPKQVWLFGKMDKPLYEKN